MLWGLLFCGNNIFCGVRTIQDSIESPKYPPDVANLCQYFEDQKAEIPDYCKWKTESFVPRRRSEF